MDELFKLWISCENAKPAMKFTASWLRGLIELTVWLHLIRVAPDQTVWTWTSCLATVCNTVKQEKFWLWHSAIRCYSFQMEVGQADCLSVRCDCDVFQTSSCSLWLNNTQLYLIIEISVTSVTTVRKCGPHTHTHTHTLAEMAGAL